MQQEDYLKKQIDQLGQVLGRILADLLNLRSSGQLLQGVESIENEITRELNLDLQALTGVSPEEAVKQLETLKGYSPENLEGLADLLRNLSCIGNTEKKSNKYQQFTILACHIYKHCNQCSTIYSLERHRKIREIENAS